MYFANTINVPALRKVIELFDIFVPKIAPMTNLYSKIVIIAISVLFFTLAGCKKDEEYPTWTQDETSLDFEWGQTKEVGFAATLIKSFGTPTTPTGWKCVIQDNKIVITSPAAGSSGAANSGTVELTAETTTGSTLTRKIAVSIRIAEEITRVANSIMVSLPNKRYKFNAGYRGGNSAEPISGAVRGALIWTTDPQSVTNVSLEDGYVYFSTGNTAELHEGNAVVAAIDKDDTILWSWHIWVTDYDPADDPDILGGFSVMNRNLGAFTNSNATPEDAARSYGLYYQWGRKDPFVGPATWNSTTPQKIYTRTGYEYAHTFAVSDKETGTVAYSIAQPNTFIASGRDNATFDWLYGTGDDGLWSPTSKTIYDPCPVGWRVAPPEIWELFTTIGGASSDPMEFNVTGEYNYGWTFVNGEETVFFPAAGRRSFSPSLANYSDNYTNVVNNEEGVGYPVGFYWSSRAPKLHSLAFRHDYINPVAPQNTSEHAPAGGFPLRCVAE